MTELIGQIAERMLADLQQRDTEFPLHFQLREAQKGLLYLLRQFIPDATWVQGYDDIADWLSDNNGKGLLLVGGCGLGKTLIATRIIPYVVKILCNKTLPTFKASQLGYADGAKDMEYYWLKVIDDIGTETELNDYGVRRYVFNEVVDRAEYRGDFLVLTTNLTAQQLRERYGVRTFDRLRAICRVVVLKGESLRARAQNCDLSALKSSG